METWHDLANVYTSLSQWRDAEVCLSKSKAIGSHSASRWHSTGIQKWHLPLSPAYYSYENCGGSFLFFYGVLDAPSPWKLRISENLLKFFCSFFSSVKASFVLFIFPFIFFSSCFPSNFPKSKWSLLLGWKQVLKVGNYLRCKHSTRIYSVDSIFLSAYNS